MLNSDVKVQEYIKLTKSQVLYYLDLLDLNYRYYITKLEKINTIGPVSNCSIPYFIIILREHNCGWLPLTS